MADMYYEDGDRDPMDDPEDLYVIRAWMVNPSASKQELQELTERHGANYYGISSSKARAMRDAALIKALVKAYTASKNYAGRKAGDDDDIRFAPLVKVSGFKLSMRDRTEAIDDYSEMLDSVFPENTHSEDHRIVWMWPDEYDVYIQNKFCDLPLVGDGRQNLTDYVNSIILAFYPEEDWVNAEMTERLGIKAFDTERKGKGNNEGSVK